MQSILIYGGSFDPPHYGHLKTACHVQNEFHFNSFLFLPCKSPVLKKTTQASAEHRLAMLQLALLDYLNFKVDTRELDRDTPSYMVETLKSFRETLGDKVSITLLIGSDAFLQLPEWHQWDRLAELSHLLIIKRPHIDLESLPQVLRLFLEKRQTEDKHQLLNQPHGNVMYYDAGHYDISSTIIREQFYQNAAVKDALPPNVYAYIKEKALYQT